MLSRRLILTGILLSGAAIVAVALVVLLMPKPPASTPVPTLASPRVLVVPDVTGFSEEHAQTALGEAGFEVTSQSEVSLTVDAGKVTRTDPPAGSSVVGETRVVIFISTGP